MPDTNIANMISSTLLPALLLCVIPALAHPPKHFDASFFKKCLHPSTPVHLSGTPTFVNLTKLNFRNGHVTPVAVVRALKPEHVSDAVRCSSWAGVGVCARSGGHSLVGKSLCAGVLIDVGAMRDVQVDDGIARVEAGINMGQLLWKLWQEKRWLAAGVCPGVGVGGYIFGGGHGPYEGRLGMACDSLVDVNIVDRYGRHLVASKEKNKELFWGLCGAGGGQFGIVTSFRIKTVESKSYDQGVVFRFNWKQKYVGQLLEKWMDYDEMNGDVWFRMEMYKESKDASGMYGYGACFDVSSAEQCMQRLNKAAFFNTPGRSTVLISKVPNALHLHAFFGPGGNWGKELAKDLKKALLEHSYSEKGQANGRSYQSTFLKKGKVNRPSAEFWQKYADYCAKPGLKSIPWLVCEMNLFNNAIDIPHNNAFAHRDADIITHYILGGGTKEDRMKAYNWMKAHFAKYTSGVYVNYPELELKEYARAYWGKNLWRLRVLKTHYDPKLFFLNTQPIPPAPWLLSPKHPSKHGNCA